MENVKYDILYPDKKGFKEPAKYVFDVRTEDRVGNLNKMIYYYRFSRFLKKAIKKEKYDKLIVFGQQVAVFLCDFLSKEYKGRFIMDYRDLGLDQRFKSAFKKILDSCEHIVISSPGFKKYLPERDDYVLSHNFDIDILKQALCDRRDEPYQLTRQNGKITVLTIGSIRDYAQNSAVIESLGNNEKFHLVFAGQGYAVSDLEKFASDRHFSNIVFTGFYKKSEEPDIIKNSTYLNIFYPRKATHETAISNRFYNSLFFRKPMITTTGTIQGDLTEKYGLGITIADTSNLKEKLQQYFDSFDSVAFEQQRNHLLNEFKNDYDFFEKTIKDFATC
jgi:hypothetical protein